MWTISRRSWLVTVISVEAAVVLGLVSACGRVSAPAVKSVQRDVGTEVRKVP